jgi:predicted RNase H-like HicB family nuclease
MTSAHYHINLFWSAEDDCWIADVPDLKYCSAHGSTAEDAAREIQIAIDAWLDVAAERGEAPPPPRYRPAIYAVRDAA